MKNRIAIHLQDARPITTFFAALFMAAVSAALPLHAAAKATEDAVRHKPNVLFILIDDMGWMDLACQGNLLVETPHLDRLAKQGMRFTDAYAASPVCSPTRAAALTGLTPGRIGVTNHVPDQKRFWPKQSKLIPPVTLDHLPAEHETIAERLHSVGYRTAFMGKWHLCGTWREGKDGRGNLDFHPEKQGFEINIGGCAYGGPPTFFDPYKIWKLPSRKPGEYLPDRLADEAIAFMTKHRDEAFFLALWNYTVHWPMEAPAHLLEKYAKHRGKPGLNDTRYGAMIEAMDAAIGRILGSLDELGIAKDTLVIFTSDNGGYSGVADNRPLRKGKGFLYEGGIRVPLIVRWPGVVKSGVVSSEPVVTMDFYPTILEATGVALDRERPLDGESLMPILRGDSERLERDMVAWHYPNYAFHRANKLGSAIRMGDFKLIDRFDDGSAELYNLRDDIGEKKDLAALMPATVRKLQSRLERWRRETGAPIPRMREATEPDLVVPAMIEGPANPGKRVRQELERYRGGDLYHTLYLPTDWRPGGSYPVIVEYAGNRYGPDKHGDVCTGRPEGSKLGYGLSGGKGAIWLCLPYVDDRRNAVQETWWGSVDRTLAYAKEAIALVAKSYGGDADRVLLTGFSRGAIACNYLGLHDDETARLWRAFAPHSHYDGSRDWSSEKDGGAAAARRLSRLAARPVFVTHEGAGVEGTRSFVEKHLGESPTNFTFLPLPTDRHTDTWLLSESPQRRMMRRWFREVMD